MRTSGKKINVSLKNQIIKSLAQVIADFKSTQEADNFLRDFFTESEIETFSKRLAIAYWLIKGRSYSNIHDNLKVSSATIATVQESLNRPGFKKALKSLEAEEWANQWAERIRKVIK